MRQTTSLRASSLPPPAWLFRLVAAMQRAAGRLSDRPGVQLGAGAVFVAALAALVSWAIGFAVLL
jgi:hypothetical protein